MGGRGCHVHCNFKRLKLERQIERLVATDINAQHNDHQASCDTFHSLPLKTHRTDVMNVYERFLFKNKNALVKVFSKIFSALFKMLGAELSCVWNVSSLRSDVNINRFIPRAQSNIPSYFIFECLL